MASELPKHGPGAAWRSRRGGSPSAPGSELPPLCLTAPNNHGAAAVSVAGLDLPGLLALPVCRVDTSRCSDSTACPADCAFEEAGLSPPVQKTCSQVSLPSPALINQGKPSIPAWDACGPALCLISRSHHPSQLKLTLVAKMMPTGAKASTAALCERRTPQPFPVVLCSRGGASRCP